MDLEKLLNDHAAVPLTSGFAEKHQDISMRFAIELLKELEKMAFRMYYQSQNNKVIELMEIESKRLELEMQLKLPTY